MQTFALHTLGCKVNTYESDLISQDMRKSGFEEVGFEEPADIYIINTCTVTNIADRKSRQMLHKARKQNPESLIIATGCYVDSVEQGKGLPETEVDVWVPNREKTRLPELCRKYLEGMKEPAGFSAVRGNCGAPGKSGAPENCTEKEYPTGNFLTRLDGHTRAFVKIEDGCNMFCTYCIIPYVRGAVITRPAEDTVQEVRLLAERGVHEIVLTGIHLSSMGKRLLETVEAVNKIDGVKRIRLGSLEPRFICREVLERLAACEKFCPHFHLSLQSGSNEILKKMKRRYTAEEFLRGCQEIRDFWPDAAITTDIIVGFPGETEENFLETCEFAKAASFYEAHVFKYSRRKGTAADQMKGQLTEAEKNIRSSRLIRQTEMQSHGYRKRFLEKKVEFLAEEAFLQEGVRYVTGYTGEYVRCILPEEGLSWKPGDLLSGTAIKLMQAGNFGELLLLETEA